MLMCECCGRIKCKEIIPEKDWDELEGLGYVVSKKCPNIEVEKTECELVKETELYIINKTLV